MSLDQDGPISSELYWTFFGASRCSSGNCHFPPHRQCKAAPLPALMYLGIWSAADFYSIIHIKIRGDNFWIQMLFLMLLRLSSLQNTPAGKLTFGYRASVAKKTQNLNTSVITVLKDMINASGLNDIKFKDIDGISWWFPIKRELPVKGSSLIVTLYVIIGEKPFWGKVLSPNPFSKDFKLKFCPWQGAPYNSQMASIFGERPVRGKI